jgi:ATP-dependent DNA helicase RecG
MKPSLQKLIKILNLEAERGYDNRAVVGGLERILESWEADARNDSLHEDLIQAVGTRLRDYAQLSESSRAEALNGLRRRLERESGESLPPLSIPEKEEESPPSTQVPEDTPAESSQTTLTPSPPEEAVEPPTTQATSESAEEAVEEPGALSASVTVLSNVGPRNAQTLGRLGLYTLRDMLYYFPRRYDDYSQLKPINHLRYGDEVTVIGTVQNVSTRSIRGRKIQLVEAVIDDNTGALRATWFNQPWIGKRLRRGAQISLSGKIEQYLGRLVINNPEWETLDQQQLSTNRVVPIYPLTAKITQRWMRKLMNQVISYWASRVPDPLPENLRREAMLVDLPSALSQIHFPDNWDKLEAARHRLAFDEIFYLQLGVQRQKRAWQERTASVFESPDDWFNLHINRLPFPLTGAQNRSLADVRNDLASARPMNRLLQGDVGSGKTVIAALAIAIVARQGAQAAFMAPTSILAEQHYRSSLELLAGGNRRINGITTPGSLQSALPALKPEQIRLMIGATPDAEKGEIRQGLADGSIKLVIGTHALIEDPVTFADLELIIVDEQHRFGVEQRAKLRSKGTNPHLLVMTATPIPRSLALTVYGDLDISVMDEMPPGRQEVSTYILTPLERERAYSLIKSQLDGGHQAFIIYPLVEESETSDSKAAVEEHTRLQEDVFYKYKLGLLHGRLKPEEKDTVMSRFHTGEYDVLVSTSVVEVGVDVPNATVMLIEGANRFGLAQLHQFRGRVGRGGDKAYCLLVPETADALENERLQAMVETNDGFVLAERDLEQRGPGEFLGTRQAGYSELKLASLTDVQLIEKARRQAQALFQRDPELINPEHQLLAANLERLWGEAGGDIS